MDTYHFEPDKIYNLDETGLSCVLAAKEKVLGSRNAKQVGKIVSADRGESVTIVGIVNASGGFIPPIYIFPRKRYHVDYMDGSVEGSFPLFNPKGYMDTAAFLKTLEHLSVHAAPSKENPILLIVDSHSSHLSLEAILFCRERGIHMLTLPPHTSHKTQPLDLTVFQPFKQYCAASFDDWVRAGNTITIQNIAKHSAIPFMKGFSSSNIKSGFRTAGIYPLNREKVFSLFRCTESAGSQLLPGAVSVVDDVAAETHVDSRTRSQIPIDKYESLHQPPLDLVETSEDSIDVTRHPHVNLHTSSDGTIVIPMKMQGESQEMANVSGSSNLLEDAYLHTTSVTSYISNSHAPADDILEFPMKVNDDDEYCMLANDPNSTESLENLEDIGHPMAFEMQSHSPFATQNDSETGNSLNDVLDLTSKTRPQIGQLLPHKRMYPNSVYPLDLSTQSNYTPVSTLRFGGLELIRPLHTPINNSKRTTRSRKMVSTIVTGSPEMRRKQELEKAKHFKEEKKREREIKKRLREAKKIDMQIKRRLKEETQVEEKIPPKKRGRPKKK